MKTRTTDKYDEARNLIRYIYDNNQRLDDDIASYYRFVATVALLTHYEQYYTWSEAWLTEIKDALSCGFLWLGIKRAHFTSLECKKRYGRRLFSQYEFDTEKNTHISILKARKAKDLESLADIAITYLQKEDMWLRSSRLEQVLQFLDPDSDDLK